MAAGIRLTTESERRRIVDIAEAMVTRFTDDDLAVLGYTAFLDRLEHGIGTHHAGMVPTFKEIVERCFAEGLVKVVFATETLAVGINMPARAVVLDKLTKYTGSGHELLKPSDLAQLTGRAGRRGLDEHGSSLVIWSPFVALDRVVGLIKSRSFNLQSAFRPTFNMATNLIRSTSEIQAHHLLNLSFAQFQTARDVVEKEARFNRRNRERLRLLELARKSAETSHDLKIRREAQRSAQRIERELQSLKRPSAENGESVAQQFANVIRLLESRDFTDGWSLTKKGTLLSRIFHEQDLLIAESVSSDIFDGLDAPRLAGLLSVFVYESRSRDGEPDRHVRDSTLRQRVKAIRQISDQLGREETALGIVRHRPIDEGFIEHAMEWCRGDRLDDVLANDSLSPGDFVRTMKQLIDLSRQLEAVFSNPDTLDQLRLAHSRLFRGVVALASTIEGGRA